MHAEPLFEAIRPRTRRLGHRVLHVVDVASTMTLARERAQAGEVEGWVVVADRQTAGVGRHGRAWRTVGQSLQASLLLRPQRPARDLQWLPLLAGLAMARSARKLAEVDVRLKWPNDLLHEGRKLGGVLVEAVYASAEVPSFVVVGVGVNGDARAEEFPAELRAAATSLSLAAGRHICLPALLKLFLEKFEDAYDRLQQGETSTLATEVASVLGTLGRRVRVRTPEAVVEGRAVALGPHGELVVETEAGRREVRAGDCEELRDA